MIGEQQTMARSGNLAEWQGRLAAQHRALEVNGIAPAAGY